MARFRIRAGRMLDRYDSWWPKRPAETSDLDQAGARHVPELDGSGYPLGSRWAKRLVDDGRAD